MRQKRGLLFLSLYLKSSFFHKLINFSMHRHQGLHAVHESVVHKRVYKVQGGEIFATDNIVKTAT